MKIYKGLAFLITIPVLLTGCNSQKSNNASSMNVESNIETVAESISEKSIDITKEPETEAIKETTWRSAYRKQLEEIMNNKQYPDQSVSFSLHDLNGDDIPELIVSKGLHREGCCIYTFNENIIEIGHFGSHSSIMYYPEKNIIESNSSESGVVSYSYYRTDKIDNGSFSKIKNLECYTPENENAQYKIDDKPVTQEEYHKAINEYIREYKVDLGMNFRLNEKTLDIAFNDYNDYKECYKDFLYGMDDADESYGFSLCDVSGDGIPELFISPGDYHAASCEIYTFNNRLIYIGSIGSWGVCNYYSDKNILCGGYTGGGVTESTYYSIDDNAAISLLAYFYDNSGTTQEKEYKIDDTDVTEEEYNEAIKKYSGENMRHLGRDFPFDKEYIEALLTDSSDWKECYKNLLLSLQDTDETYRFSLYDITGDDVPELFISDGFKRVNSCKIYSFDEGLIFMESLGIDGEICYSPDSKIFGDYDIAQGHEYFMYYTLDENNNFKHEITLYNNVGAAPTEEDVKYEINHEEVSYDEYKSELDKYREIDDFISLGRDYEFTEEDILKAFS